MNNPEMMQQMFENPLVQVLEYLIRVHPFWIFVMLFLINFNLFLEHDVESRTHSTNDYE